MVLEDSHNDDEAVQTSETYAGIPFGSIGATPVATSVSSTGERFS